MNAALIDLDRDFASIYAPGFGRPSIAPERLLRAMLLQAFYGIRSERQLMERMEFDLLFRWFVGLGIDDAAWDHSSFSTNRHPGYDASQHCRKRIEEVFGWIKSSAGMAKVKLRGYARVNAAFTLNLAAYNLIRLPRLSAPPAGASP